MLQSRLQDQGWAIYSKCYSLGFKTRGGSSTLNVMSRLQDQGWAVYSKCYSLGFKIRGGPSTLNVTVLASRSGVGGLL